MKNQLNEEIFKRHAELCGVLSNYKRLMILALLHQQERSVGELVEILETHKANISQHLRVLREYHLVNTRKDGQTVYYSLRDERLMDVCKVTRAILLESMKSEGKIAQGIDPDNLMIVG